MSLRDQLLVYTARSYERGKTPFKVHIDTLLVDDALHLKVTNFDSSGGIRKKASSLAIKTDEDVEVLETVATVQCAVGDGPPHEIAMVEDDWPVMSDHDNLCTITDKTTGNELLCSSDQEFQRHTVTMAGQTLGIITNPDGTYSVNDRPAATVDEAAALIGESAVGRTASLHSLGAIYATLIERKKFLESPAEVAQALPMTSWRVATLSPIDCGDGGKSKVGPPPPDPSALVRAVIAWRAKQS